MVSDRWVFMHRTVGPEVKCSVVRQVLKGIRTFDTSKHEKPPPQVGPKHIYFGKRDFFKSAFFGTHFSARWSVLGQADEPLELHRKSLELNRRSHLPKVLEAAYNGGWHSSFGIAILL